jgi:hypothetical protein
MGQIQQKRQTCESWRWQVAEPAAAKRSQVVLFSLNRSMQFLDECEHAGCVSSENDRSFCIFTALENNHHRIMYMSACKATIRHWSVLRSHFEVKKRETVIHFFAFAEKPMSVLLRK